jgi:dihydroorotase
MPAKGAVLTDFRALQRAGAVGVSDDGKPILNDSVMRETMRSLPKSTSGHSARGRHAHDRPLLHERRAHRISPGLRGMKAAAEARWWNATFRLAQQFTGARLHVAHLSTADALKGGAPGEAQQVSRDLRSDAASLRADRRGCWRVRLQLQDESAAALGFGPRSHHGGAGRWHRGLRLPPITRPTLPHEKIIEFERAAFGITGLETALGLAITHLHRGQKISLSRIVELLTSGPARVSA